MFSQDIVVPFFKNVAYGFFAGVKEDTLSKSILQTDIKLAHLNFSINSIKQAYNLFADCICVYATQNHTNEVIFIDQNNIDTIFSYTKDALITKDNTVTLTLYTADCCPVFIIDSISMQIAAIHCGHKGVYSGIINNTISLMQITNFTEVYAILGPCIQQKSYEVSLNFYEKIILENSLFKNCFVPSNNLAKYYFDLVHYITLNLQFRGFLRNNIVIYDIDTFDNRSFYSYRRENKISNNSYKRNISMIRFVV